MNLAKERTRSVPYSESASSTSKQQVPLEAVLAPADVTPISPVPGMHAGAVPASSHHVLR